MLVPMVSSGVISGGFGGHFVRSGVRKQSLLRRPHAHLKTAKKPPQGLFRNRVHRDQWALAQTFFLVKYSSTVSRIRNTNTCRPSALRASMCGSAVHIRNVVTSLAYCATVAGEPSS